MELIKASHVDKNMIYEEKKLKNLISSFYGFLFLLGDLKIMFRMA